MQEKLHTPLALPAAPAESTRPNVITAQAFDIVDTPIVDQAPPITPDSGLTSGEAAPIVYEITTVGSRPDDDAIYKPAVLSEPTRAPKSHDSVQSAPNVEAIGFQREYTAIMTKYIDRLAAIYRRTEETVDAIEKPEPIPSLEAGSAFQSEELTARLNEYAAMFALASMLRGQLYRRAGGRLSGSRLAR